MRVWEFEGPWKHTLFKWPHRTGDVKRKTCDSPIVWLDLIVPLFSLFNDVMLRSVLFFKRMLEYLTLCKACRCTDFLFVLQNGWVVKYKIKLIDQFVTVFSLTNSYSTLDNFVSQVCVCIQIHIYSFTLEWKTNSLLLPKKEVWWYIFDHRKNIETLWAVVSASEKLG